jgi:hypothetical protein
LRGADSGSASVAAGSAGGAPGAPGATGVGPTRAGEPRAEGLARVVFAVLVLACFVAFAVTQRLKHTPTAVQRFEMNPAFYPTRVAAAGCHGRVPRGLVNASKRIEYLSFKTSQADAVTVAIVNTAGGEEAGIVRDLPVERYKQVSLCWNGHRGPRQHGPLAPPGEYRVRVGLRSQNLTRYSPEGFALRAGRP